jgi:pimeloyl-[acyl-carrier protein] synthase
MDSSCRSFDDWVAQDPDRTLRYIVAYDEVRSGLVDERLSADRLHAFADRAPAAAVDAVRRDAPWLISGEGTAYPWIRPLGLAGLRSAADEASQRAMRGAADELIGALVDSDRFNVASDYALTLSIWVLADFLGVDRRDTGRLVDWGHDLIAFFNALEITVAGPERMARSASALATYALTSLRQGGATDDGAFLARTARAAAQQSLPLDEQSIGMITLPLLTGALGVAHLVTNTVWLLLTHDDQRARLAADRRLVGGAVAEALRRTSPVALVPRIAIEPVAIGDVVVEPGEAVYLSVAAANCDPAQFSDPDRYDITRPQAGALGFGHGAHSCIGGGLVRVQATIAVDALLDRMPDLVLDPEGEVVWSLIPGLQAVDILDVCRGQRVGQ